VSDGCAPNEHELFSGLSWGEFIATNLPNLRLPTEPLWGAFAGNESQGLVAGGYGFRMLDVRHFRNDTEAVAAGLARRGADVAAVERVRLLDDKVRKLTVKRDALRAEVRQISNEVGQLFRAKRGDEAKELQEHSRVLGAEEKVLDSEAEAVAAELRDQLLRIPNLPADDCPDGVGEADNVVLEVHGFDPDAYADHQKVPHWEVGEELGILDVERGVKMSGSMFVMYRKQGAQLVRALCQLALDRNADLYEEVRPPTLVRTDTMVATGHLPKFEEDAYHIERDELWAIPTAEVPLTSLGRDEVYQEADLPQRFTAHTSCFRREAGSAGKDTRGLLRVHEFDKVEILAYCTPDQAPDLHQEILDRAESMISDLGLPYRILDLCAGDLGGSARRTYDIEVYSPGVEQWLEVSSVSWFGDYQARRANLRYRRSEGAGTDILHTVNGSALAVPRVWAALVETNRQHDGTVAIPELLQPYMRGETSIR
jgi:seryl-tRNA synthetase